MLLWFVELYTNYAIAITIITIITVGTEIYDTMNSVINIKAMAEYSCKVKVLRYNKEIIIDSTELVPSDLVLFD